MAKQVPVAMIGAGFMGRAHSNAYLKVAKFFDLPATPVMSRVIDTQPALAREMAARWGWNAHGQDWREAIADPAIGLVDICLPNDLHAQVAIAALEAGKAVACEKPLAHTLDDARAMRDAARKAGARGYVWYSYRGCPALALARQMVQEGRLGRLHHIRAAYLQDWGKPSTPWAWRFDKTRAGSGALGDICSHAIDAARFVSGQEVKEVCGAMLETFVPQRPMPDGSGPRASTVDDAVLFLARMGDGALASFEATRVAPGHKNAHRLELNGDRGSLRWDFESMNELWFHDATTPAADYPGWRRIMVTDTSHPFVAAWWPEGHVLGYEHGFINLAALMFQSLGSGSSAPSLASPFTPGGGMADFEEAYQVQRVVEAVERSAKSHCWIALDEVK